MLLPGKVACTGQKPSMCHLKDCRNVVCTSNPCAVCMSDPCTGRIYFMDKMNNQSFEESSCKKSETDLLF